MIECRGNGRVNIDWLERNKIILNTDGVFVKGSDRNRERYIKETLNNKSYMYFIHISRRDTQHRKLQSLHHSEPA